MENINVTSEEFVLDWGNSNIFKPELFVNSTRAILSYSDHPENFIRKYIVLSKYDGVYAFQYLDLNMSYQDYSDSFTERNTGCSRVLFEGLDQDEIMVFLKSIEGLGYIAETHFITGENGIFIYNNEMLSDKRVGNIINEFNLVVD